jgi:hypothetical protein
MRESMTMTSGSTRTQAALYAVEHKLVDPPKA